MATTHMEETADNYSASTEDIVIGETSSEEY